MAGELKIFFNSFLEGLTNVGPFSPSDTDWAPAGVFAPEPAVPSTRPPAPRDHAGMMESVLYPLGNSYFVKALDKSGCLVEIEVDREGRLTVGELAPTRYVEPAKEWR